MEGDSATADTTKAPRLGWAQEQLLLGIFDAEQRVIDAGSSDEREDLEARGVRWIVPSLVQAPGHPNLTSIVAHAAAILERHNLIIRTPPTQTRTAGLLNRWVRLTPAGQVIAERLACVRAESPHDLAQPRGQQRTRQTPPLATPVLVGMAPDLAETVQPLLTALSPADQVTAGMALVRAGLAAGGDAPPDHRAWFTVQEVAGLVRIGRDTIAKAITSGALSTTRTPYGHRISPEDLHAWLSQGWVDRRTLTKRERDVSEGQATMR